jgi:hypothetical protein
MRTCGISVAFANMACMEHNHIIYSQARCAKRVEAIKYGSRVGVVEFCCLGRKLS